MANSPLAEFREILRADQPLAPLTSLRIGGPAQWLATPRSTDELARLVRRCRDAAIPYRVLAGGTNILAPDEGVAGVVIRLAAEPFRQIAIHGTVATAGAGAALPDLIAEACKARASGLEALVGIPGTVGGAVRHNAGGRTGDIGQFVKQVELMDERGEITTRMRPDIRFGYRKSNLDDVVLLSFIFELAEDDPDRIVRRIKKIWISKKAKQPFGFQACGCALRDPRGLSAAALIESAGLSPVRVGGAELSDRDPRFVIAHPGTTSRDVVRLLEMVRTKVEERAGVRLELQLDVW
jgi:UDP-N-acetylmuramate dehydrogenase